MLVLIVGATGLLGVIFATSKIGRVSDDLAPVTAANAGILRELTAAETNIVAWSSTGEASYLARYEAVTAMLSRHEKVLFEESSDDAGLRALVGRQKVASDAWLAQVAGIRLTGPTGVESSRPGPFAGGAERFERIQQANHAISHKLGLEIVEARARSDGQVAWIGLGVALTALLGAAAALFFGRVIGREIAGPLVSLRRMVTRLAAGENSVRAVPSGPQETRRVAQAINDFADKNDRVRALEQQVVEQLRDLDRAKTDFMSNISHELRTPLTSIGGYIELFEEDLGTLRPHQASMLEAVKRNVERLKSLIEDLLTLSNTESETFRTAFDKLDLAHLTSDVAYDMQAVAAQRGITICDITPDHPVRMLGDSGQLSRALMNLVANAVKFSSFGGAVTIALTERDGSAVVEVADQGIGIPVAEAPMLATRFFRATNAVDAEIPGSGLGLRIVRAIADNHGGRLEIDSVEGEGTTTRLVLPVRQGNKVLSEALASR